MKTIKNEIVPGTIILKKANWFRRIFLKLFRKSIVSEMIFINSSCSMSIDEILDIIAGNITILIPIKPYNKEEIEKVDNIVTSSKTFSEKDLLTMIENIRPNTLDVNEHIEQLLNNKYYKQIYVNK